MRSGSATAWRIPPGPAAAVRSTSSHTTADVFDSPPWRPGLIAAWIAGFALYQWLFPTGPSWWVELVEELAWLGSAEEIADRIKPFAEAGATHLMLGDVTGTTYAPEDAMRVLGSELPKLKKLLESI